MALEKLTNKKISAAMPVRAAEKNAPAQYIRYIQQPFVPIPVVMKLTPYLHPFFDRYTPAQQGVAYNSGAKQRIIRMVEAQKDPMEPPRFKTNQKIPRGPPSPPAPVLHSPTRKVSYTEQCTCRGENIINMQVTVKEQQEWKIPPCISNWKNPKVQYTRCLIIGFAISSLHLIPLRSLPL